MFRRFWLVFLKLKGWNTNSNFPTHIKKCVIVVAPHTGSEDFFIGLALRSCFKITDTKFLGKAELFKPPFGFIFKWVGGIPVDRFSNQNMVQQVVAHFKTNEIFRFGLSPEGTRKKVLKLKTGFYHIAKQADVPIVMVGLDYEAKQATCSEPFYTTNNEEKDFEYIIDFFSSFKGKIPENGLQHLKKNALD
jgi:1-acyl-sn-glycerol-3-phosphate acyltransferase